MAYPTDGKLYDDTRRSLVRLAEKGKLRRRQGYSRCGKVELIALGRSARGHHKARLRKHTKKLKTGPGRVPRDAERKLHPEQFNERWTGALKLGRCLLTQQRTDADKMFSVPSCPVGKRSPGAYRNEAAERHRR